MNDLLLDFSFYLHLEQSVRTGKMALYLKVYFSHCFHFQRNMYF